MNSVALLHNCEPRGRQVLGLCTVYVHIDIVLFIVSCRHSNTESVPKGCPYLVLYLVARPDYAAASHGITFK